MAQQLHHALLAARLSPSAAQAHTPWGHRDCKGSGLLSHFAILRVPLVIQEGELCAALNANSHQVIFKNLRESDSSMSMLLIF